MIQIGQLIQEKQSHFCDSPEYDISRGATEPNVLTYGLSGRSVV